MDNNPEYLDPENDTSGPIEYKRLIHTTDHSRLLNLSTQLSWRMNQHPDNNTAYYYLGIDDNGLITNQDNSSINTSINNIKINKRKVRKFAIKVIM